jgi:inosine-uridine nucleoside N-ribohydrolase
MTCKKITIAPLLFFTLSIILLSTTSGICQNSKKSKPKVLFDTDANNELDDQYAMAYLFFNGDVFDVVGVPKADQPVEGRHGGKFEHFGDYSVDLYEHIHTSDDAGTRALFDMAAVAIVKNPDWAEKRTVPAPVLTGGKWKERPGNNRKIIIWENFNKEKIMKDFYERMDNYVLLTP